MADTNYPATLVKMKKWVDDNLHFLIEQTKLYEEICTAIETEHGDPNDLHLTASQIAKLQGDKADLEFWIEGICSVWDVEPVEVEE